MGRRARNAFLYGLLSFVSVIVLGAGVGYWRISQGPLKLGFLSGPIENFVNASLDGMRLRVKDVVIERDPETNTIHLRLRRAQLEDRDGQMIARAPRAGVGLSATALLTGEVRPTNLEFIGPRILIKRTIDGEFQLGFGDAVAEDPSDQPSGKSDALVPGAAEQSVEPPIEQLQPGSGGVLEAVLKAFAARNADNSKASNLESISISNAAVSIYDEANESFWYAPKTNLVFQRVPYGISVLAHGNVASGQNPWKLQLAANYVTETGRFKVTAKVFDLVPAEMSKLVFALSNLAKVQIPLSGEANFEFDNKGTLIDAKASFAAGAGLVGFPGFITESILVDEGTLRLNYEPDTGDIVIEDSAIYVGGSRASLNGRFSPLTNEAGQMVSWRYRLSARNVSLDTEGTLRDPLAIDEFDVRGLAAIEEGRLDIEDLRLSAGDSRIQLRGTFIEGPEVPAVYLRGTMRNASLPVIKKLWPPAAAQGARQWVVDNMSDDAVLDGDLTVNLTSEALAAALQGAALPNDQLSFAFKLHDVTTKYFRDLPAITNATAVGQLRGNDFEVRMDQGVVTLDSGEQIKISNGRFYLENLAEHGTMGDIKVDVSGSSAALLRLIDHEPLGYARAAGLKPDDLGGSNVTHLHVRLPMLQDVTFEQVDINAQAELSDMRLASVFNDADIEAGSMVLDVNKQGLVGKGKVVLNGAKTALVWTENFEGGPGATKIEASLVLTEETRKRLNIDLSGFLSGPVPVRLTAVKGKTDFDRVHVDADLAGAELYFDQLKWRRLAGKGAKASFDVRFGADGSTTVTNLDLAGPEHLSMNGGLTVDAKGRIAKIDMPQVNLGPGNRLSVQGGRTGDGVLAFRINGDSFDARPLVDSMFSSDAPAQAPSANGGPDGSGDAISVVAQIKTLFFHNHEHLTNVAATVQASGGGLQNFRMSGRYANGKGLEVNITADGSGQRPMQVVSDDAGATLRAVNLYTRSHGGTLKLTAVMGAPESGELKQGKLKLKNFEVHDEGILRELGSTTQQANASAQGVSDVTRFNVLKLKFHIDRTHLRIIDEALINGPSIGSTARGSIRRADGQLNIGGTLTPAYALNSAIGNVPILGDIITGGEGQGVFGVTFAVTGTLRKPRVTINPVSALTPGIFRRFMEIGGDTPALPTDDIENSQRPQKLER